MKYCSQSWEMRLLLVSKIRQELKLSINGYIKVEIGDNDLIIISVDNTNYNFKFVRSYEIDDELFSTKINLSKSLIEEFVKSYQKAVTRAFFISNEERQEMKRRSDLYNKI